MSARRPCPSLPFAALLAGLLAGLFAASPSARAGGAAPAAAAGTAVPDATSPPEERATAAEDALRARGWEDLCAPGTRIGRIDVQRVNVFDPAEKGEDKALFRVVNALHRPMLTREHTVRRILTLRRGDDCTPARLEEAERALRTWPFLQDAWVEATGREGDLVHIRVRVQDAWTTSARISLSSQGGANKSVFKLDEDNLLGLGANLSWERREDQDRVQKILDFRGPALFGRRDVIALQTQDNSDGRRQYAAYSRPFWSLATPRAFDAEYDDYARQDKVYVGPEAVDRWDVDGRRTGARYGVSLGADEQRLRRVYGGVYQTRQSWTLAPADGTAATRPDLAPRDRDLVQVFGRFSWERIDFRRVQHVNRAVRVEDLDLGTRVQLDLYQSVPGVSADDGTWARLDVAHGLAPGPGTFVQLAGAVQVERLRGDWLNTLVSGEARWYRRLGPFSTLHARGLLIYGGNIEGPNRFLLGGDTGLRGYASRAFTGERLALANLECRWFLPYEIAHVVRPGIVAFVEAGGAWDGGLGWDDLHPDVGVGLRLAVAKSSGGTTLHFNVAVPLDPNGDPEGESVRFSFLTAAGF